MEEFRKPIFSNREVGFFVLKLLSIAVKLIIREG
jgi:hypothetical protein